MGGGEGVHKEVKKYSKKLLLQLQLLNPWNHSHQISLKYCKRDKERTPLYILMVGIYIYIYILHIFTNLN